MSSAFLALLSILLVLPSANYHLFNGLPLSNVPEFGLSFTPKPRTPLALGLLPLPYLGVHFFFTIAVYYPRQIIIGYIAMALSSMYAAAFVMDRDRRHRRSLENPPI